MTLQTFLAIASFAMAVGGLFALFLPTPTATRGKKETVLAVVLAALLATTGMALYEHSQHAALLDQVEKEILEELTTRGPLTFDQLYQAVHYRAFPDVTDALFRAVEQKRIGHDMIELQVNGKPVIVRNYFTNA